MKMFLSLLFLFSATAIQVNAQKINFDKAAFYNVLESGNLEEIDAQLAIVKASSINEKEAYEGVLLMKKAGLAAKAKDKLSLFKAGRPKLEAAIKKESSNAEYAFLRLIIQENAPKAVNYRSSMEADSQLIRSNYKTLPQAVQQAIIGYSKKSKVLKPILP